MAKDYLPKGIPRPGAFVIKGTGPRKRPPLQRRVPVPRKPEGPERAAAVLSRRARVPRTLSPGCTVKTCGNPSPAPRNTVRNPSRLYKR